jgi:hypothetical protein
MASGKVARRSGVSDVAELLSSPEVEGLIAAVEAVGDRRGRKGFGTRALVGACLVKGLFALPSWTWVAALIGEHPGLQAALGGQPSVWACYRFSTKLRKNEPLLAECLDEVVAALREQLPHFGRDVAIDASDLPAWANGQRYVSHFDAVRARGIQPETVAMDKGYDITLVYGECEARGALPVVPLRGTKGKQPAVPVATGGRLFPHIARHTERFRNLYRGRAAVEREFGRLKHDYGLAPLRVRGQGRVALHADITMLGRLSLALLRNRQAVGATA